jgi:hypothetical protein
MDVQVESLSAASSMVLDVQGVRFSTTSSVNVQGISLSTACRLDVQGACIPFHLCEVFFKCRTVRYPGTVSPVLECTKVPMPE